MEQKYEKYLPIGSVVMLKKATKKVMITGFMIKKIDDEKVYDYTGCLYPEGMIDSQKNLLFNHEDIFRIYAIGYSDDEEKAFKEMIKEGLESMNQ